MDITMKKAGWDCMNRFYEYEILANGCVPIFYRY